MGKNEGGDEGSHAGIFHDEQAKEVLGCSKVRKCHQNQHQIRRKNKN